MPGVASSVQRIYELQSVPPSPNPLPPEEEGLMAPSQNGTRDVRLTPKRDDEVSAGPFANGPYAPAEVVEM
jgi:hypothetical protein